MRVEEELVLWREMEVVYVYMGGALLQVCGGSMKVLGGECKYGVDCMKVLGLKKS